MNKSDKESLKKYFLSTGWSWNAAAKIYFDLLIEASTFSKGRVILDAGAGFQRFQPFFINSLYLSQEHKDGIAFKGMTKVSYDFISPLDEKIPLKDNSIDAILSTSTIEHIRYPEVFFQEAFRVLKPGGKLFISVPFVYFEHETPYDFNRPTRYGLARWLEDVGFKDYSIKPGSSSIYPFLAHLPNILVSEILGTDKNAYELFREKRRKMGWRIIFEVPKFAFAFFLFRFSNLFKYIVLSLFDKGSYPNAIFPIGWISVATKPGHLSKPIKNLSRNDFVKKYSLK